MGKAYLDFAREILEGRGGRLRVRDTRAVFNERRSATALYETSASQDQGTVLSEGLGNAAPGDGGDEGDGDGDGAGDGDPDSDRSPPSSSIPTSTPTRAISTLSPQFPRRPHEDKPDKKNVHRRKKSASVAPCRDAVWARWDIARRSLRLVGFAIFAAYALAVVFALMGERDLAETILKHTVPGISGKVCGLVLVGMSCRKSG